MATKERLIGADGLIEIGTSTVGATLASGAWGIILASGTGTGSAGAEGWTNGDFVKSITSMSGTGASYATIAFSATPFADISSWSCEFSADEIEVTVLADDVKKYRRGKIDASGSMKGIVILGTTTASGTSGTAGILPRFLKSAYTTLSGTVYNPSEVNASVGSTLYFRGIMQKDRTVGERYAFIFGQVELYNFSVGGDIGSAQEFDSKFRFVNYDPVYVEEYIQA